MALFKCKMCGGDLAIEENSSIAVCEYCGRKQTLPKLDDERRLNLYDRANHFRRNNEFDKAMGIYEQILNEDSSDAEAYWSIVLCRYGIEYVEDPATKRRVPTVNRAQFTSIFADEDYKAAIAHADPLQRSIYEDEAQEIDGIQKGILAISQKEEPFDVFICYKETDNNGRRTPDSVLANDLYHQLTNEGFKVFFSRITLEDKLGTAYEPYIFAALNSAKVMVVLGTKPEYFNAVWVKNEWSRYLALVKKSGGKKVLIPAFKDMDPYDLPEEFSHLQAQDMDKLGFMQDLIRGIKKILSPETADRSSTIIVSQAGNANTSALLKRVFIFLEDGAWNDADEYSERVLDSDPENAMAYVGKLLAALRVSKIEKLNDLPTPFDQNNNYKKALRYGDNELRATLEKSISSINERNELERLNRIYNDAVYKKNKAYTPGEFEAAAKSFQSIRDFNDSEAQAQICTERAKELEYQRAVSAMSKAKTYTDFNAAAKLFDPIKGYRDAEKLADECREKATESAYSAAIAVMNYSTTEVSYISAAKLFAEIHGYRDASQLEAECRNSAKECIYKEALKLYNSANSEAAFKSAAQKFISIQGYKDSDEYVKRCSDSAENCRRELIYKDAVVAMEKGALRDYETALRHFTRIPEYKDSASRIEECKKLIAEKEAQFAEEKRKIAEKTEREKRERAAAAEKERQAKLKKAEKQKRAELRRKRFIKLVKIGAISLAALAIVSVVVFFASAKQRKYNKALLQLKEGNIVEAYQMLSSLNGYKDSAEKVNAYAEKVNAYKEAKALENASIGSVVHFGSYEQDGDTSNGKETVEWIVLKKDGNRMLVVSRFALDFQQYNADNISVTWETCSLRKWLNSSFLNATFSRAEQDMIECSTVASSKNPAYDTPEGSDTKDMIFLLSLDEAYKYFDSNSRRACKATAYVQSQDASTVNNNCWWWLRTPGMFANYAVAGDRFGGVNRSGCAVSGFAAIRPALWINLGLDS